MQREVSRADLGDDWPLTVESGVLRCEGSAVTLESGGTVYYLNGTAKGRGIGEDPASIWADDEANKMGLKKSLATLVIMGLDLCNEVDPT